jgi:Protein of unknown function (DUF2934)
MSTIRRKTAKSERTSAPMMKMTKATKAPRASHTEIAARAYALYLARGGEHGHAEADWLRAEAELASH